MREHLIYARWLDVGTRAAFIALVIGFGVYVLEIFEAHVPPRELVQLWALPVDHYVAATRAPTGWGWLGLLHKADYLNFVGIVALATITIVCYARVLLVLPRLQATLAAIQIAILLAAALF